MTGKCPHKHFCSTFQQIQWLKFILQRNWSNYITLSSCEVFAICTLLKVYLEECGPVTVSQVAQSFFSAQDVPLRTFSCARHSLSRPVHWSRTEQQITSIPASLLTACLCLQTDTKQKVEFTANLQDNRSINCIQLYRPFLMIQDLLQ